MKKQSLILLALLMVISCSKPNVQKEMKIVEQEAAPVVEEPKIVKQKAGTLKGHVKYDGKAPKLKRLKEEMTEGQIARAKEVARDLMTGRKFQ